MNRDRWRTTKDFAYLFAQKGWKELDGKQVELRVNGERKAQFKLKIDGLQLWPSRRVRRVSVSEPGPCELWLNGKILLSYELPKYHFIFGGPVYLDINGKPLLEIAV